MTQPDGSDPGHLGPSHPGGFADWRNLTQADIADRTKAPLVGAGGSYTQVQESIGADDGNVIPTGSGLWQSFTRNADATFPRILLAPRADQTASGGGSGSAHSHSIPYDDPPDYQPAGGGANTVELGFFSVSKDREYSRLTFGTGNSVTALGISAMYAGAYLMNPNTGALQLMASVAGDIKATVANTNSEYTLTLSTAVEALKSEIWAVGLLQVTGFGQNCKSILATKLWQYAAPAGLRPAALYGTGPASTTLPSTIPYGSITFNPGLCPYYALS